jgi:hypothetical protein
MNGVGAREVTREDGHIATPTRWSHADSAAEKT